MEESEGYYKLYGEKTGELAVTANGNEKIVKKICDDFNSSGVLKEKIIYTKIEKDEYDKLLKNLEKKDLENKILKIRTYKINPNELIGLS